MSPTSSGSVCYYLYSKCIFYRVLPSLPRSGHWLPGFDSVAKPLWSSRIKTSRYAGSDDRLQRPPASSGRMDADGTDLDLRGLHVAWRQTDKAVLSRLTLRSVGVETGKTNEQSPCSVMALPTSLHAAGYCGHEVGGPRYLEAVVHRIQLLDSTVARREVVRGRDKIVKRGRQRRRRCTVAADAPASAGRRKLA